MEVAGLIINGVEAIAFLLAGLGAIGFVRRSKQTAAKVAEVHALLTEQRDR